MKNVVRFFVCIVLLSVFACGGKPAEKKESKKIFDELSRIALDMDGRISGVLAAAGFAAIKAEKIFNDEYFGKTNFKFDPKIYYRNDIGLLSDHDHKTDSNVYVDHKTQLDDYTKWFIAKTEDMIPVWKENFENYPYLGWQYILETKYTSLRVFPWVETTKSFGRDIYWPKFEFYKMVTPAKNPDRQIVFRTLGTDVLGLGLLAAASAPIYRGNEFVGVSAIDFPITRTFKDHLYEDLPGRDSYLALIDGEFSQVILRKDIKEGERGWDKTFNYTFLSKYSKDDAAYEQIYKRIMSDNNGVVKYPQDKNGERCIYYRHLKNANWVLTITSDCYE